MTTGSAPTIDAAGGDIGGAARWHAELSRYLASTSTAGSDSVRVIGKGHRLTPTWLIRRELLARGSALTIAPNNASFAASGERRVVLAVNALHYLYPFEEHLLDRFSRGWRIQIPVVRRLLRRADLVVAPCWDMLERVVYHVPEVAHRLEVRPHPVTPLGYRERSDLPFILVPVVPSPYKNLFSQLRLLVEAADLVNHPAEIRVTASRDQLPPELNSEARIVPVGIMPFEDLANLWATAWSVFFPSTVEAFGFPLAEARAYGVPVLAPGTRQAAEIAGPALRAYDPGSARSLADALAAANEPLTPDPDPFDRTAYFRYLFGESASDSALTRSQPGAHEPERR